MEQDFSGQILRGKSFRGQDLKGANFSRADLRGANFARANLEGANFSYAKAGLTNLRKILLLAIAYSLAFLTGILPYLLSILVSQVSFPKQLFALQSLSAIVLTIVLIFALLLTVRQSSEALNRLTMTFLIITVVIDSMILGQHPMWGSILATIGLAVASAVGLAQAVAITVAGAELVRGKVAGCFAGAIAATIAYLAAYLEGIAGWIPLGAVALGIYMGWQAVQDDIKYAEIAQAAIWFAGIGGTNFRQANLTDANFSQARLKNTDLRQAILTRTRFYKSTLLEQARLGHSILRVPAVRELAVTGNGRKKSYRDTNLTGANLQGADLSGANLQDANLSQATLKGANLELANLTRIAGIGTDFRNALMTGACLDGWDIDATTQLEQVDCRYVYLAPSPSGSIRLPSQGDWKAGEFTHQFAVTDTDERSIFESDASTATSTVNPQEILASLMVLVKIAIADNQFEDTERELLSEAIKALQLPGEITVERLLDERIGLENLLQKIQSPLIKEKVYQSAYLMARIDGELELEEEALLERIQTRLGLSPRKVEKLQNLVTEIQNTSIAEQVQAIADPQKREAAVNTNVRLMSLMHAFCGAMPIPGFALVTHLMIYKDQLELVQKISRIWGYSDAHRSPVLEKVLFGSLGVTAARIAISNVVLLIPFLGSVISASTAFSMTWAIGELTKKFFARGGQIDESTLKQEFALAKIEGQKIFQESQRAIVEKQQAAASKIQALQTNLQEGKLDQQEYLQQLKELARE